MIEDKNIAEDEPEKELDYLQQAELHIKEGFVTEDDFKKKSYSCEILGGLLFLAFIGNVIWLAVAKIQFVVMLPMIISFLISIFILFYISRNRDMIQYLYRKQKKEQAEEESKSQMKDKSKE